MIAKILNYSIQMIFAFLSPALCQAAFADCKTFHVSEQCSGSEKKSYAKPKKYLKFKADI